MNSTEDRIRTIKIETELEELKQQLNSQSLPAEERLLIRQEKVLKESQLNVLYKLIDPEGENSYIPTDLT